MCRPRCVPCPTGPRAHCVRFSGRNRTEMDALPLTSRRVAVRLQYRRIGLLWHIVYPAQWLKKYAFLVGFKLLAYCYSVGGVLW